MARIIEDQTKYEAWTNSSHGRHVIKRVGRDGRIEDELIGSMKTFHVTPAERRLNMERAANESLDPFRNGQFLPVRLIEDAEDLDEIKANPNLIGDDELATLLNGAKTHYKEFDKRLSTITNPVVLNRIMELAIEQDATVRQVERIKERLEQVAPSKSVDVTPSHVAPDRQVHLPVKNL